MTVTVGRPSGSIIIGRVATSAASFWPATKSFFTC